ncbi:uncharacterized protein LOC133917883 [Phragmites australis]|uniref:uncharacterized protein LOC133917883 n=1 Tax=Phragmites australis TaxID=29695 RepID=UPI002D79CA40|nr:uncharacterized protein LOC133917883 [Phragmites australis]
MGSTEPLHSTSTAISTVVATSTSSINVVNVKMHIPIMLDFVISNYSKWSQFFTMMCGKFDLFHHIDSTIASRPDDPAWVQADYAIVFWLFGSVSNDVLNVTMEPDQRAHDLWLVIKGNFRNNKEPRAIYLSAQFHSLIQVDMMVTSYSQRMKQLADALRDLDHLVFDPYLVLNQLCGLAPCLSHQADLTTRKDPFPSFASARNALLLAEMHASHAAGAAAGTTLIASSLTPAFGAGGCQGTACANAPSSSKQLGGKNRGCGK